MVQYIWWPTWSVGRSSAPLRLLSSTPPTLLTTWKRLWRSRSLPLVLVSVGFATVRVVQVRRGPQRPHRPARALRPLPRPGTTLNLCSLLLLCCYNNAPRRCSSRGDSGESCRPSQCAEHGRGVAAVAVGTQARTRRRTSCGRCSRGTTRTATRASTSTSCWPWWCVLLHERTHVVEPGALQLLLERLRTLQ